MYKLGIDIGYSSIKINLLNQKNELIYTNYHIHKTLWKDFLRKEISSLKETFNLSKIYIGITGEQGKFFKDYFINEVLCLSKGAISLNTNIASIMELGAQSARYLKGFEEGNIKNLQVFSNTSCSAGTGSFLEEQVSRLGIDLEDFSKLALKATKIPNIAGRCSVFSKTDIIHHQQEGVKEEDILLGLSYSLVRNYKANVIQKNSIEKPIFLSGGVLKNAAVLRAVKDVFHLEDKDFVVNKNCANTLAFGAGIIAYEKGSLIQIDDFILHIENLNTVKESLSNLSALSNFGEYEGYNKHLCTKENIDISSCFLGIDVGSTSTNLLLTDKDKNVLTYRYLRTKGNPIKAVEEGLDSIKKEFGENLKILSIGTTGSGRKLIGDKFGAELVVNEITAQVRGAIYSYPEADTIFEIGGQDSKYMHIIAGNLDNFEMNKICAAGTGSFIEEQIKKIGLNLDEFNEYALRSKNPLDLGSRCTVFIEGNISKALAEGYSKEDICGGLAYSIVNNYLDRVVGTRAVGEKILFQGGVTHNVAILTAFKSRLGKEIIIPQFFSVTGALGAALLTMEEYYKTKVQEEILEDIKQEELVEKLFLRNYTGAIDKQKRTIGIPRVLFLQKLFPMFNIFFSELGYNVVLSEMTNEKIVKLSQEYSLDETCYPIKLVNGHVASLIEQKVDYIFLPSLYTMKHEVSKMREDYACVYMQTIPKIVSKVMGLEEKGIKLLSPALSFNFGKKYMMKTLLKMGLSLHKNPIKVVQSLKKGMKALQEFEKGVEKLGKDLIEKLSKDEKVFVIITRTYGVVDKGLNMEIPKILKKMGYKVITLSHLPAHSMDISNEYPNMYWPFGQHILSGAKIVRNSENLYAIYLTNHGCGPDGIISHYFKEEMGDKPYLQIEVDEHSSSVGVVTRLEAFVESVKRYSHKEPKEKSKLENKELKKLLIPYLYPYSSLVSAYFKGKNIDVQELPKTSDESLSIGRSFSTSKEYLSNLCLLGDAFHSIENNIAEFGHFFVPQSEGAETFGQYSQLLKTKLSSKEKNNFSVENPFIEDMFSNSNYGYPFFKVLALGDLIMNAKPEYRDEILSKYKKILEKDEVSEKSLIELAKEIKNKLALEKFDKSFYALGEFLTVFNEKLNNYSLKTLEKNNRVMYMPLSELLYFKKIDFLNKENDLHKEYSKNLQKSKKLIEVLHRTLEEFSPFEENIINFIKNSDKFLNLYAGGSGRYRIHKQNSIKNVDGIILVNSMYENTGTILKILANEENQNIPILNLEFDGSKHGSSQEKLENFIYCL